MMIRIQNEQERRYYRHTRWGFIALFLFLLSFWVGVVVLIAAKLF